MIKLGLGLTGLACIAGSFVFPDLTRWLAALALLCLTIAVLRSRFEK
jgi:hypothetical protein